MRRHEMEIRKKGTMFTVQVQDRLADAVVDRAILKKVVAVARQSVRMFLVRRPEVFVAESVEEAEIAHRSRTG